ncbi:MAG: IgGFc-binding protein [Myxococcales bacterium]|nr:IgGFc-binding protein [Myxococcales bacterium]
MISATRTCTLIAFAACTGLACGDDGRADASDSNPMTMTGVTTPTAVTDTTGAPPPTTTTPPDTDPTGDPSSDPSTDPSADTGTTATTADTTATADTSTTADTGGTSSTGPAQCEQGDIVCDGTTAQVCDGNGGFESQTPCADACAPGLGCVACVPGSGKCDGDTVQTCSDDGTGYVDGPACDPLLGLECDPDVGACAGPCADIDSLSYIGCEYYPVVTAQLDNFIADNPFAVAVANTAGTTASVTVTRDGAVVATVDVPADSVELIELPWVDELVLGQGPSVIAPGGAYRLRSTRPVTVYQYNPLDAGITNDASLLLPVNTWTGNYVVASWQYWDLGDAGIYSVTASQDDTTVTVTPPGGGTPTQAGDGIDAMGHGEVVLDAGDVLQVFVAPGGDSTGALVTADRPVQVLGGHECTEVPIGPNACDHLEESMFPVEALAREYFVVPPAQAPPNDALAKAVVVRVIASEPDTTLMFEPDQAVNKVLADAGDFVEIPTTTTRFVVRADKKILVAEYMVGQQAGYGASDPDMLLVVPSEQFRSDYLFYAETGWLANYVDIVAPAGASVQVDGAPASGFVAIGDTGYGHTHVKLSNAGNGVHTVTSDQRVGISVYGVQNFGSYWYPGGLDLELVPQ